MSGVENRKTYIAAMSPSLEVFDSLCLALHTLTRHQADIASHVVHNNLDVTSFNGMTVENTDKSNGDWHNIETRTI